MTKYFITGGAGFIGTNFTAYIMNKYQDDLMLINMDKLTYAANLKKLEAFKKKDNYYFIREDIVNRDKVAAVVEEFRPDYIINFAAESHVDRSIVNPGLFLRTNILGTQSLLDAALKFNVKKFIQISTDEVYGSLGKKGTFLENDNLNPSSPYSASKAAADLLVSSYGKTFGLAYNITRCSNNYGPWQFPEKLIPLTIKNCLENKAIPVYGDGSNVRDWIWVKDHCCAIDEVVNRGQAGEIYNIGASCEISNIDLIKLIIDEVKKQLALDDIRKDKIDADLISYVKDRKGHDFRYALNTDKINAALAWQAKLGLREGIKKTVKWYLNNYR